MATMVDVAAEVAQIKGKLDSADSPDTILALLDELNKFDVTQPLLESTKVGVSVGQLTKRENPEIKEKSKALVRKWMEAVVGPKKDKSPKSVASPRGEGVDAADYQGPRTYQDGRDKNRRLLWKALCDGADSATMAGFCPTRTSDIVGRLAAFPCRASAVVRST
eukprot:GHVU01222997.1.p1 GENE.GHVU01222997.1~~GHVU01222997.1.p1  ORF type:complete len:164 (-),score=19.20 GHVU01222997.1:799-1290(-)